MGEKLESSHTTSQESFEDVPVFLIRLFKDKAVLKSKTITWSKSV